MKTPEVESRTQDSRLRTHLPKTDPLDVKGPRTKSGRVLVKKNIFAQKVTNYPQNSGDVHKKKIFGRKFASSLACSSNAHDLGKFSAIQKIVLFLSRRHGIFEDLQASWPRSRISNCVLEDSTSGNHRASYHMVHIWKNVRVTYANTLLLNIKFLAK